MQRVYCTQEGLEEMITATSKWPDPELFDAVKAEGTKNRDSEDKVIAVEIRDAVTDEITTQEVEGKSLGANWKMKDALSDLINSNEDKSSNKFPNANSLIKKEKRRRRKAERGINSKSGESSESEGNDVFDNLFNISEDGFSPHFGTDSEDEKQRFYERKKKIKREANGVYALNADTETDKEYMKPQMLTQMTYPTGILKKY